MIFDLVFLGWIAFVVVILMVFSYLSDRRQPTPTEVRPYDWAIDGGCDWQSKPRVMP